MPKKKAVKAAEKALEKARRAVADARKSVKNLDKKTRREADALRVELKDAEKLARKSSKRAERTASKRASGSAPNDTVSDPAAGPTYRELRERAKDQGIPGYSRMNKIALAAALSG